MTMLMAEEVGPIGTVYAVEISSAFIDHIRRRAAAASLQNVRTVLCTQDSVELSPQSIDLAFICDTYHHFEFPARTMKTIHRALRPGGRVVVVDFKRIPGLSREWILNHVRAGRQTVIDEIVNMGFELISDGDEVLFLEENYLIQFRKPE
jgi:ubiquinone/menaquinone biosynthesis C-methylase UbiE